MAKKINKNNITRYVAMGILGTSLLACAGINVYDNHFDHTEEMCLICRLEYGTTYVENQIGTIGTIHQMNEMKREYDEKGMDVKVAYVEKYRDNEVNELRTRLPKVKIGSSGIKYSTPKGYKLAELDGEYYAIPPEFEPKFIDGEWYGVQRVVSYTSDDINRAIVTYGKNPETNDYDEEIGVIKIK